LPFGSGAMMFFVHLFCFKIKAYKYNNNSLLQTHGPHRCDYKHTSLMEKKASHTHSGALEN